MPKRLVTRWLTLALIGATIFPASAQVAPSPAQIASYTGLLAAAQAGDIPRIEALLASKSPLELRDAQQRTAVHIATEAV